MHPAGWTDRSRSGERPEDQQRMGRLLLPPVAAASLPAATAVLLNEDRSTTAISLAAILARAAIRADRFTTFAEEKFNGWRADR